MAKEKSIEQMRSELRQFYLTKVAKDLDKINDISANAKKEGLVVILIMLDLVFIGGVVFLGVIEPLFASIFLALIIFTTIMLLKTGLNLKQGDVLGEAADSKVKENLMKDFLKIFGDYSWTKGEKDFKVYNFIRQRKQLNIMGPSLLGRIDDMITGKYMGVKFKICEFDTSLSFQNIITYLPLVVFLILAVVMLGAFCFAITYTLSVILHIKGILWTVPVLILLMILFIIYKSIFYVPFQGVFIEFDMNKKFQGHTFFIEKAPSNRCIHFKHKWFEEIKLEDPEFCKNYKVYSNNQIEARYILTTAFIERLKQMETAFNKKYMRAAFKNNKIVIAIDARKDLFSMTEMNRKTTEQTFNTMFEEILSVLELIRELKLNQKLGL